MPFTYGKSQRLSDECTTTSRTSIRFSNLHSFWTLIEGYACLHCLGHLKVVQRYVLSGVKYDTLDSYTWIRWFPIKIGKHWSTQRKMVKGELTMKVCKSLSFVCAQLLAVCCESPNMYWTDIVCTWGRA